MKVEPVTISNINSLKPGEWIWDNQTITRRAHERTLGDKKIEEPIGFRHIHILNLKDFPKYSNKPFMLSTIDDSLWRFEWVTFKEGRFYKFKKGV